MYHISLDQVSFSHSSAWQEELARRDLAERLQVSLESISVEFLVICRSWHNCFHCLQDVSRHQTLRKLYIARRLDDEEEAANDDDYSG